MRKLLSDTSGNTAIIFAAAAIPMVLGAGLALDLARANHTQSILQGAADAAALAGASSGQADVAKLNAIVVDYAKANGVDNVLDIVEEIKPVHDKANRTFSVTITGKMETSLMQLANIMDMDINAYSEVALGGGALELVLVLDSTASMSEQGRMTALKAAADDMILDLMKLKAEGVDVKIGIVPFSNYVNVGMANRNADWITVPDDGTQATKWWTYPDAVASNCRNETYTSYNDGVASTVTSQVCDWDYGVGVEQTGIADVKWYGCVGSRNDPLDEGIGSYSDRYVGLMQTWCTSPLVDLSDDEDQLRTAISGLTTSGNTYIPAGLIWGWNMISSNAPLKKAKTSADMASKGGTKAIVLMTDGANTLSPTYPEHNGSDAATSNAKTTDICDNIKSDGVTMFTVSFMVDSASAQDIMTGCASDSSKSYDADNAQQLAKAFKDIASTLSALRISK